MPERDVIVGCWVCSIAGVNNNRGNTDLGAAGRPCLFPINLISFQLKGFGRITEVDSLLLHEKNRMDRKITYEGSRADFHSGRRLAHGAVACCEHSVGVEENTTAKVRIALRQTDDIWKVASSSYGATYNLR